MGRKGIGKLALFSIADEIRGTYPRWSKERTPCIQDDDGGCQDGDHRLKVIPPSADRLQGQKRGTKENCPTSCLQKRKNGPRHRTDPSALLKKRKRIARRFSVIGSEGLGGGDSFSVAINGISVGPDDREDLKETETFLFQYYPATIWH